MRYWRRFCNLVCALSLATCVSADEPAREDWIAVGGDRGCQRYSTLTQINRDNVQNLEVAWSFYTGELSRKPQKTIECTPLVVDGMLYLTTGYLSVVALKADSGEEVWSFDPYADRAPAGPFASGGVNRGLAYWTDEVQGTGRSTQPVTNLQVQGTGRPTQPVTNLQVQGTGRPTPRVIHGTADGRLWALDAATGKLVPEFGDGGIKDLREDLSRKIDQLAYGPTSAPAICGDVIVIGVSNGEGPGEAAPGDIRGFDVRTGKQLWQFHTVPHPGEFGHETWEGDGWKNRGGANAWGGISVDEERELIFCGLGSAAFDFFGGDRPGQNLFANSTLALHARTGERAWHFQTLHHDLWDHDLPIYPNLVTVRRDGKDVPAVAQVTKTGFVYVFDRETGQPLFDIVETPVPASPVEGEAAWPTQPIPVKPPPFAAQHFDSSNVTDIGQENRDFVLAQLKKIRSGPAFNPPSLEGTVVIPGFHGGANWSGAAFDPTSGLLYVNSTNLPNIITLAKAEPTSRYAFRHTGYIQFVDQEGYPAIKPPWGELNAIDLNSGEIRWHVPLGEYPELAARGVPQTGTENFGGAIVTAGGLVFIAGTKDEMIRAFDKETGKVLWQHRLPAGGYATPATYACGGKQYVVIAAGGAGKLRTRAGDAFIAFALPD